VKAAAERHERIAGFPQALTAGAVGDCLPSKVANENEKFTDLIISDPNTGALKLRAYTFEVVEGPDRGQSVRIDRGSVVVGSAPDADLVLTDSAVSRTHVKLVPFGDAVEITDLGSKNGVFLSGTRLMQARVAPGTEFTIGRSTIRIVPDDREALVEPSERTQFGPLRGRSRTMRQLFAVLELAAKSDSPVLVEGESGVGKMRTARSSIIFSSATLSGHAYACMRPRSAGPSSNVE
jgi:pSer/pThr/pTyr-binding forkhead associated (FHA) protein